MDYISRVAQLLNECSDQGLGQKEMADKLGIASKNYISMISGKNKNTTSPLPLARIPSLVELCGLSPKEGLELVFLRAKCHPDNPTAFDTATMACIMSWTRTVLAERETAKEVFHGE